jgi:hypothetical protein
VDDDEVVRAWASLPRRIYLETSTLQTVYDYGEVIWDGVALELAGRASRVQGLAQEVDALLARRPPGPGPVVTGRLVLVLVVHRHDRHLHPCLLGVQENRERWRN